MRRRDRTERLARVRAVVGASLVELLDVDTVTAPLPAPAGEPAGRDDDAEWSALEKEWAELPWTDADRQEWVVAQPTRAKALSYQPHPSSYGASLPLGPMDYVVGKTLKPKTPARPGGRKVKGISPAAPHARSYRPDLPLGGFTDVQLVRSTKVDRATWTARPLTYTVPANA